METILEDVRFGLRNVDQTRIATIAAWLALAGDPVKHGDIQPGRGISATSGAVREFRRIVALVDRARASQDGSAGFGPRPQAVAPRRISIGKKK